MRWRTIVFVCCLFTLIFVGINVFFFNVTSMSFKDS
ncbi:hypothetical protein M5D96_004843 [Drosophila gunungcola]|uniref:Uncharacterized protein n=1 Tax=Drosophila gunungcola TaxID=103775 RepID=A0A9P9YUW1_9MUSC|nr:hypothetical protein M5D96_004843 [Drosophila gunungcola]